MGIKDANFIKECIVSAGYRHIDTASCYENEEIVGQGINMALKEGISREELFVTTKCYVHETEDPMAAIKRSLEKL